MYAEPYPFGCCCEHVALQSEVLLHALMQQYAAAQSPFFAQSLSLEARCDVLQRVQSALPAQVPVLESAAALVPSAASPASPTANGRASSCRA